MKCKYLNQFRLSEFGWTVESCTASNRPYAPSISELHDYCKGNEFKNCPIMAKIKTGNGHKDSSIRIQEHTTVMGL